jgi:hypothetical protein
MIPASAKTVSQHYLSIKLVFNVGYKPSVESAQTVHNTD